MKGLLVENRCVVEAVSCFANLVCSIRWLQIANRSVSAEMWRKAACHETSR